MAGFEIFILALFVSVAGLNVVARWLAVPYPIPLVLGGLVLGFLPGMPEIKLQPDLVLVVFLPPLLYSAAFFSDLRALRDNLRPITLLSVGLVLVTTVAVAVLGHEVIGLAWPMAFALGAIVSPTDPVAATAVMRRLGAPRRLVNVIEGESLVNDATALVAYRVAVGAAVGGSFSVLGAGLDFLGMAAGGIAIGLAVGYAVEQIRRRLDDAVTEITISLLTAYAAFIPAERLGLSGVLAAVTTGVYLGWRAHELASPQTRLQAFALWEILIFLLNATLFIFIGLQLPVIVSGLDARPFGELIGYSALVCAAVIGMRFLWSFTVPYVVRALDRRPQQRERRAVASWRVVSAWSGMRGAVSLAAALALPLTTDTGAPLPDRDLILFITFAVILVTLVGQGLTLPLLIRWLGVREDGADEEAEEVRARLAASRAALERLDELESEDWTREDTIERARGLYRFRGRRAKVRAGKLEDEDGIEDRSLAYQRLQHELFAVQRAALVQLRNAGEISNDVMHRVEHELDLEESRLEV
ncbi:MAG: monovalent cation/hydrogen antiporter [Solirubrobacteraceae bacterium]|nr:monovalent cation/hydrogen antiporter [Solirubrobacteraceae bacterium]